MTADTSKLHRTRYSLLCRLRDWGDRTGWQEFFDTYWRLIYEVALKAGLTETEAQDVVQETVLVVARNISGFKLDHRRGSFKAWLLHQTRWRIVDELRRRPPGHDRRHLRPDNSGLTSTLNRLPDPATDPLETLWEAEWKQHVLGGALEAVKQQVSPRLFQIYDLVALQGLPVQRVCELLNVTPMRVYLAKHRVGRRVRSEIQRRERPAR